jgi:hypothetical protein
MRVLTRMNVLRVYTFSKHEKDYLKWMGIWGILNERLLPDERIEVDE